MEIPEKLNTVFLHEMPAKLTNAITECMISNQMTLECLELACNEVKEVYKKNAVIKKAD
jgi:hypothetical protein